MSNQQKIIDPDAETLVTLEFDGDRWEIRRDIDMEWRTECVYAAHTTCTFSYTKRRGDPLYSHLWSWEGGPSIIPQDGPEKDRRCWFCGCPVPEDVVGAVFMYNVSKGE